ncbi:MAG: right-handed parallel beta-helix repeat-containing protein, partial [Thermoproteota archaeon]|nr:right-handed parallel beta-helix repeat-containing protein [Thermoproteota archaeon]
VIGITQTPNGDIYYGAYHLYKLVSVFENKSNQILFPLKFDYSNNIVIDNVLAKSGNYVIVDLHFNGNHHNTSANSTSEYIKLQLPKSLINDIGNVNASIISSKDEIIQKIIPLSLDNPSLKYNDITIPIAFNGTKIKIMVNAATIITTPINDSITNHGFKNNIHDKNFDNAIIPLAVNSPKHNTHPSSTIVGCVNYDSNTNIITVACNSNLSQIDRVVNNRTILEKDPFGVWILKASIIVNPTAMITINDSDTSWLKIINKNDKKPNFISIFGSAKIDHVKITSLDLFSNDTIKQNVNGSIPRPYIVIEKSAGNVNISNSEVAFLGYNHYPSNGFVYANGGNKSSIINNIFHDMWDGFYSDSVGFITIKDNKYYNNLRYGIDPHSGSHDLKIIGNIAHNNGQIGIICSDNCYNILFDNNTVHDNLLTGLMFSLQTNNSTAKKNYAYNEKVGISIFSSSNDNVYDNLLKSNKNGIFIGGNSSDNHIFNNTLVNNRIGVDFADQPKNNTVENNNLQNRSSSIHFTR